MILLAISAAVRLAIFVIVIPYEGMFSIPSSSPEVYQEIWRNLEPYQDFKLLYMNDVNRFLNGSQPYQDFFHAYPPLFLYTLSIFASFHLPIWTSAIPIIAYDALTVVPMFLIARRLTNDRWASAITLLASLTPMVLWYNDILWLNPPPSTFFMLLSACLLLSGRSRLSSVALGLAFGYKQTSVVLFPVMLIGVFRAGSRRKAVEFAALYIAVCFAVSLPYIVQYPSIYLWSLGVPGIPTPSMYGQPTNEWKYDISTPINIATYVGIFGFTSLAVSLREPLWFVLIASYCLLVWRVARRKEIGQVDFVAYLLYSILLFDTLFPRGIYKYFIISALPFLAILLSRRRHIPLFLAYGLAVLAVPRFLTPLLTLLLITLTPYLHWDRVQPKHLQIKPFGQQREYDTDSSR